MAGLTALFAALLLVTVRAAPACVTGRSDGWLAFNAGGDSNKALNFAAENKKYFVGSAGAYYETSAEIVVPPNSKKAAIFKSERYTKETRLVYSIPVPDGVYTVITMHAEIYHSAAGKRKFHIDINGYRKRTDLDVFADANGKNKGIELKHYNVRAKNGAIEVAFVKSVENPQVSGIVIKGKGAETLAYGCCDRTCTNAEKCKLRKKPVTPSEPLPSISSAPSASSISEPSMTEKSEPVMAKHPEPSVSASSEPSMNPSSEPSMSASAEPVPSASNSAGPVSIPSKATPPQVTSPKSTGGCGDGKYIFCEDFDDLALGKTERKGKWILDGKASIAVSPGRKSKALYLDPSGAGGEKGRLIVKRGISAPGNSMYGRLRVWVKEFATEPPYAHFVMAEVFKADSGGGEAEGGTEKLRPVGGQFVPGSGSLWGIGADGGATGDWTQHRKTAPTVDGKWVCVEWSMMAKNSEIKVWLDGVAKPEMTVDVDQHDGGHGKLVFPKFDSAWFGWWLFQGNAKPAKFDVYMDDIALAETRIGC